jgi:hypothetical protein
MGLQRGCDPLGGASQKRRSVACGAHKFLGAIDRPFGRWECRQVWTVGLSRHQSSIAGSD